MRITALVVGGLVSMAVLGPLTATAAADPFVGVSADQCFQGGGTASYGTCVGGAYDGFDTDIAQ